MKSMQRVQHALPQTTFAEKTLSQTMFLLQTKLAPDTIAPETMAPEMMAMASQQQVGDRRAMKEAAPLQRLQPIPDQTATRLPINSQVIDVQPITDQTATLNGQVIDDHEQFWDNWNQACVRAYTLIVCMVVTLH